MKYRLISKIVSTIIGIIVGMWVLTGSKIVYGHVLKGKYGTYQEYHLEVWGKRVS